MSAAPSPEPLATAATHLMAAKMFSLASCVMLYYDMAITFGDEVERIWKRPFTGATVLWFLNRYISPLGYVVIIVSFHDPDWSKAACDRYVLYPEALKIVTAFTIGVIFILRLYSIYGQNRVVLYGFGLLLAFELAVKIWAFTDGTSLALPPGFVGCILVGRSASTKRIVYTWVAELAFDSTVFFATLFRTIWLYRNTRIKETQSLITLIMRDGIMYFAAIFATNIVTVMFFLFAVEDLKVVNASFSTLITSLMVSRLMLNLRGEVQRRGPVIHNFNSRGTSTVPDTFQLSTNRTMDLKTFESSIIGNLGAPIVAFPDSPRRSGRPPAPYYSDFDDFDDLEDFEDDFGRQTPLERVPSGGKSEDGIEMRVHAPPGRVIVQVTEEVFVEESRGDGNGGGGGVAGARAPTPHSLRRSWMAPTSWRLARDADEAAPGRAVGPPV